LPITGRGGMGATDKMPDAYINIGLQAVCGWIRRQSGVVRKVAFGKE
jgi:hypothetical protein